MLANKSMRKRLPVFSVWILVAVVCLHPQLGRSSAHAASASEGRNTFAARCANCHGLDGRGTERGPDIAARKEVQRLPGSALLRIVQEGVPGTGMPPFRALGKTRIESVVAYLRILQGKGVDARLPGDPTEGKTLFFSKAECSTCHLIQGGGAGGFIGADLTNFATNRSVDEIRKAILDVGVPATRANTLATVTLRDGTKLNGLVRNEDNFSLQLQTMEGAFYSLSKAECQIEYSSQRVMPTDYGSRLTPKELDHLASYLIDVARIAASRSDLSHSGSKKRQQADSD